MKINGKTKLYGLLGNPVEHTLSPILQNGLASELGDNLIYVALKVAKENLVTALKGGKALGFSGMNVTLPYKQEVIPFLVEVDPLAQNIGAVNTLVSIEGGYKGFNTDIDGLFQDFKQKEIELRGKEVIILGAGGAARVAAFLCAREGVSTIYLLNRTKYKALEISDDVKNRFPDCSLKVYSLEDHGKIPKGKYLVIQGTSIGLSPDTEHVVITDTSFYRKIHTGYDMIYQPAKTMFMSLVEQEGGNAYNGLGMLLYQGIKAYELWNQVTISEEVAAKIELQMRKELGENE